jgi:hypothetical protein
MEHAPTVRPATPTAGDTYIPASLLLVDLRIRSAPREEGPEGRPWRIDYEELE